MEVQIEIVDIHIVYNTIDNEPFKIVIIKAPFGVGNMRFAMFIWYDDLLWLSIISEETLKKIQKSNDILLHKPFHGNFGFLLRIIIGTLVIQCFNKVSNTEDLFNYMHNYLDLFEIDEQQYVLK